MAQRFLHRSIAGAAIGVAALAAALPASAQSNTVYAHEVAQVNCDTPRTYAEANACTAAKSGVDALRRYVESTRPINRFTMQQFANVRFPAVADARDAAPGATKLAATR